MVDPCVPIVIGWLADNSLEFNVYLHCQSQVKLTGTPCAPYVRRLGSVCQSEVDLPGPSVRGVREPIRGIFVSIVWLRLPLGSDDLRIY